MSSVGFGVEIRARGAVNVKTPIWAVSSAAYAARYTMPEYAHVAATYRFAQQNQGSPYFSILGTVGYNGITQSESVYAASSYRFAQISQGAPICNIASIALGVPNASGIYETLFRPIVDIRSTARSMDDQQRLHGNTLYSFANQGSTDVYHDLDEPIQTVDNVKIISWYGPSAPDDYVSIEYRRRRDDGVWENEWHDIYKTLPYVIADNGLVKPEFSWSAVVDSENHDVTYDLVIAHDYGLENTVLVKTGLVDTSYVLTDGESLDTDRTYFWSIRTHDSIGDVSEWAPVRVFQTFEFLPPIARVIDGSNKVLIPFRNYMHEWNVSNLEAGMYQYAVRKIKIDGSESVDIVPRIGAGARYLIVDHDATNPPVITNLFYDPQAYKLGFDVKILDSKFRTYDIKSVSFATQQAKITGKDGTGYYLQSYNWHQIPLTELVGRKKNMGSNPYISNNAILGWVNNARRVQGKTYTYDVQVHSTSSPFISNVRYGYRSYLSDGTWSAWTMNDLDHENPSFFTPPRGYRPDTPPARYSSPYYGKARRTGYVMNTVYLTANVGRDDLKWEFGLFDETGNAVYTEQSTRPFVAIKPDRFFDAGLTNVMLDLAGIEEEYYELHAIEIDKISSLHSNKDFFWRVRSFDGMDYSPWSSIQVSKDFNIHSFQWDVRNNDDFTSTNFVVVKVELALSVPVRKFQYPNFRWLKIGNPQIEQYIDQIRAMEARKAELPSYLSSIYDAYISYLKRRILDVRNYVLDGLIEDDYFDDLASFENFIATNMVDGAVVYENGGYVSELDVHDDFMELTKDLESDYSRWSSLLYNWKLDFKNRRFSSQEGKPLRIYDKIGMSCENATYSKCYLTTGSKTSCPWFGRSDLGFCKGFVTSMEVSGNTNDDMPLPADLNSAPDPEVDPEGYARYLADNPTLDQLYDIEESAHATEEIDLVFDQGACPMAVGAALGVSGGPCAKYKQIDSIHSQKKCEICGEKRYEQMLGARSDNSDILTNDIFSYINPAGFAATSITLNGEEVSTWGPLGNRGQSLNPQMAFTGLSLKKTQLPGELNGDFLDAANESVIKNPFFNSPLQSESQFTEDPGVYTDGWHPIEKSDTSEAQVIEII